jgi:hypothetical protein
MGGDWRDGFEFAWMRPDPEPDEGPGLTWRQLDPHHWSGMWETKIRATVTLDSDGWVAYLRLEDPPGLSPITTVGRFATVGEAQVAMDDLWCPGDAKASGSYSRPATGRGIPHAPASRPAAPPASRPAAPPASRATGRGEVARYQRRSCQKPVITSCYVGVGAGGGGAGGVRTGSPGS